MKPCMGDFNDSKLMCQECEDKEKCRESRAAIRELTIQKLDSGSRQLLIGHLWTIGDALASNPIADSIRIIMLCEAFMNSFGVTELGKTGLMDSELYDQVQEVHNDLTDYLHVMTEIVPKCKSEVEFEVLGEPTLIALENKYSKKTGKAIYGEPTKILRAIKDIFYDKTMFPRIISQITTVTSLNATGYNTGFNNASVPRFRRPDVDGRGQK